MLRGDAVDHSGVPVIQDSGQVGEEDHRDPGLRAEVPVGEVDTPSGTVRVDACLYDPTTSPLASRSALGVAGRAVVGRAPSGFCHHGLLVIGL